MGGFTFSRATGSGYDRVYVSDAEGRAVGWFDPTSGDCRLVSPDRETELRAAVAEFRDGAGTQRPATPSAPAPVATPMPASVSPDPRDLSLNRPGQALRARATAEWGDAKRRHPVLAPVARFLDVKTDERAWRVGAAGEERIGAKLDRLVKHGWRILHSVPVGKGDSDIDHVLIGPGGVFTVNTKNLPGARVWVARYQIRVNGRPVNFLRNSRFEGERASRLLTRVAGFPVEVVPCLVILTGGGEPRVTTKQKPDGVVVLTSWDVPAYFKHRRSVLGPDAVEAIFDVARRGEMWAR